jgi:hypothetical protein
MNKAIVLSVGTAHSYLKDGGKERKERKGKHAISFSAFGGFVVRFLILWGVKICCDLGFAQQVVGGGETNQCDLQAYYGVPREGGIYSTDPLLCFT